MVETITIYSADGAKKYEVTPNERCKRYYQLMGDDYITLEFADAYRPSYARPHSTPAREVPPPAFRIGDYCEMYGERYVVNERQSPTYNKADASYNYSLRMVAEYRTWRNYVVKELTQTAAGEYATASAIYKLTATLRDHALHLLSVLAVNGQYDTSEIRLNGLKKYIDIQADYFKNSKRDSENKLMTYDGMSVLEAIDKLCSAEMYDCEWWATRQGGRYTLHFGRREMKDSSVEPIVIGENAASISEEGSRNEFANRIYVLGGTQNMPYSYRKKLLYTNTSDTGTKLTDANRPMEHEMFERNARQTLYDCDRIDGIKTYTTLTQAMNTATFRIAEKGELPAGKYKLEAMAIDHTLTLSGMTYKGFVVSAKYTLRGSATIRGKETPLFAQRTYAATITRLNERWAHDGDEWPSASGSKSTTIIPEDEEIVIQDTAMNVNIELQVDFVVDYIFTNSSKPYLQFKITGAGNAIFKRTDLYIADCVVKKYPTGETSHAEFQESTHWGTNEVVPDYPLRLKMQRGDQYEVDGLIYNRIKQHYYTSDRGEDVINGLSEIRLNLPENAETEDGVICRNGYVEKADSKDGIVEKVIIHDDIFPSEVSMIVQGYGKEKRPAKMTYPDSSVAEREFDVYIIKDTYINNNPQNAFSKDYILDGVTLQAKFKTGDLAGMTFDVEFGHELKQDVEDERDDANPYTQTYLIVPNTNYGALLPNDRLHPREGDEMLLIGWDCNSIEGLGMIAKAEEILLAAALDDLEAATKGSTTYRVEMQSNSYFTPETLHDKSGQELQDSSGETLTSLDVSGEDNLQVGQLVELTDYALFDQEHSYSSEPMRIIGYETALDYPWASPVYIVGEIPKPTRRETIEQLTKQIKSK